MIFLCLIPFISLIYTGNCRQQWLWAGNYPQEFHSPNYPSLYPNNANCTWNIRKYSYGILEIKFSDFRTENSYDYVEVFDNDNGYSVEYISGFVKSKTVRVRSNSVTVRFHSDSSARLQGFSATYRTSKLIRILTVLVL